MTATDQQVRKLMEEMSKHGKLELASMRAGMDRATGRKYMKAGKLPSELRQERWWRTRQDPFAGDWLAIVERLEDAPELEAKALFEDLMRRRPGAYQPGQLRTFQRRVRKWRATSGPPKEVFFAQNHRPGEAMQTDFTWVTQLGMTICGEPVPPMLCHTVLPYSNWESAVPSWSESMLAIRHGVQAAAFKLTRVTAFHQTDHSSAATHQVGGKREFNEEYLGLMKHLGMEPRTIAVGAKEQNGDVEAANGALKRRLKQHLLLRGSRDFESLQAYEHWLEAVLDQANRLRQKRLDEELAVMRLLSVKRLVDFREETVRVTSWSTIRVKRNTYSVPSRLIGEHVKVRLYENRLEVYYNGERQLEVERLRGQGGHEINYRHIIWSLVRKPGAFARYRYRQALFPTPTFRQAYDTLLAAQDERKADLAYLRIVHLAASTMEAEVEVALRLILDSGEDLSWEAVQAYVSPPQPSIPDVAEPTVDLAAYDSLLSQEVWA